MGRAIPFFEARAISSEFILVCSSTISWLNFFSSGSVAFWLPNSASVTSVKPPSAAAMANSESLTADFAAVAWAWAWGAIRAAARAARLRVRIIDLSPGLRVSISRSVGRTGRRAVAPSDPRNPQNPRRADRYSQIFMANEG